MAQNTDGSTVCGFTCTRPWDPALIPGGIVPFDSAFRIWVNPANGSLHVTGDATAGARVGRDQAWEVPFVP